MYKSGDVFKLMLSSGIVWFCVAMFCQQLLEDRMGQVGYIDFVVKNWSDTPWQLWGGVIIVTIASWIFVARIILRSEEPVKIKLTTATGTFDAYVFRGKEPGTGLPLAVNTPEMPTCKKPKEGMSEEN